MRVGWGLKSETIIMGLSSLGGEMTESLLACCLPRMNTARRHLSTSQEEVSLQYPTVQVPWSWSPSLQRLENTNFGCLSHPLCGILSWQPKQTNTDSLQILMLFDFINLKRGTRQKDLEIAKYLYFYPHLLTWDFYLSVFKGLTSKNLGLD